MHQTGQPRPEELNHPDEPGQILSGGPLIREPGTGQLRQLPVPVALPDVTHLSEGYLDSIIANFNVYFRLRGETS